MNPKPEAQRLVWRLYPSILGWGCVLAIGLYLWADWKAALSGIVGSGCAVVLLAGWHLSLHWGINQRHRPNFLLVLSIFLRYALIGAGFYAIIRVLGDQGRFYLGWFLAGFSTLLPGLLTAMWVR